MIPCGCYPCFCRRNWPGDAGAKEPCLRPKSTDNHVRLWKRGGYWAVEMFTGDELQAAYIGEPDAKEAFERARVWLTATEQKQLQASLATNQETRP